MDEWQWEIYEDFKLEPPIVSGRICDGLYKSPHDLISGLIRAKAAEDWAVVERVERVPFNHDGVEKSIHTMSNGERWRLELTRLC